MTAIRKKIRLSALRSWWLDRNKTTNDSKQYIAAIQCFKKTGKPRFHVRLSYRRTSAGMHEVERRRMLKPKPVYSKPFKNLDSGLRRNDELVKFILLLHLFGKVPACPLIHYCHCLHTTHMFRTLAFEDLLAPQTFNVSHNPCRFFF